MARASLIAVRAFAGGPLVSQPIKELRRHIPNVDTRIVAMFRDDASVRVDGDTMIQPGDEVFFLAATRDVRTVMDELRRMDKPVRTVMIAGGGNIGLRFARALSTGEGLDVAQRSASRSSRATSAAPSIWRSRHRLTCWCSMATAPTRSCCCRKACRCRSVRRADQRRREQHHELAARQAARSAPGDFADQSQELRRSDAGRPDRYRDFAVLRDDVGPAALRSTRRRRGRAHAAAGAAEALELIVHGDARTSRVIGKTIEQIEMPRGAIIGAMVRGHGDQAQVLMAHHDVAIQPEDHLIIFVENKRLIARVEKMFTVGVGFFS